jgi:2-pyrone-4,6-dicarboxylate lactonase
MNFSQTSVAEGAEAPGRVLAAGACDCHAHVYGPYDRFPLGYLAPFQPAQAPIEALEKLWGTFGIKRGVLIQGSAYGGDHRALLAAISRDGKNRRGVALVDTETPVAALEHLQRNGVCGGRVNFVRHLNHNGFDEASCWQIVKRIEPLGWHLELHIDAVDLGRIRKFVRESPVEVVIDHMGRVDAEFGLGQASFRILLELVSSPSCWVKLSGADRLARQADLKSAVPFARSLVEAAPQRVVWGTDWPHVNLKESPSDEAIFGLLAQIAPDERERTKLLAENPARLYGFLPPV